MRLYGIIGFPLSHSFSPAYFNNRFAEAGMDAYYETFPLSSITELPQLLLQQPQLCGFNVTIPYKTAILPYLQELSPDAQAIGAVNCVQVKDGLLYGHNTDHQGFSKSLQPLLPGTPSLRALVLGTGGSSKAITYSLRQLAIPYRLVSRQPSGNEQLSYAQLDETIMAQHRLIINTTPAGMFPHTEQCPDIPYHYLGKDHILYDLIYNPAQTLFLQQGSARAATVKNGADMLRIQAELGWEIWMKGEF